MRTFAPTAREKDLLDFLQRHFTRTGTMPSYAEMGAALGLASRASVHRLVVGLEQRGHIRRLPHKARAIQFTTGEVPTAEAIKAVLTRCRISPGCAAELRGLLTGAA